MSSAARQRPGSTAWRSSFSWRLVAPFALLSLAGVATTVLLTDYKARQALLASTADRLALSSHERDEAIRRWLTDKRRELEFLAALPAVRRGLPGGAAPGAWGELPGLPSAATAPFPDFAAFRLAPAPGGKKGRPDAPVRRDDAPAGERYLALAVPLASPGGGEFLSLEARLRLDRLDEVLREPRGLERSARVLLVDRRHVPLAGAGRQGGGEGAAATVRTTGTERALRGETGWALYRDHRSVPVIGFYRWLPALETALLVEMDEETAFAPARDLGIQLASAGVFVAALLSLLVLAVARRVARPLVALTAAVQEVERGNLDVAVPVESGDEVGILGGAFNRMTAHLKGLYGALRESERGTREILDATSDAILLHDAATGAVLDANRSATAIFGYSRDELLRARLEELCAGGADAGEELRRRMGRSVLLGPQRFEWLARHRDGRHVWVEAILAATDVGGKGRVLSSSRDITGRKASEAEIARHREHLEELVRERSDELEAAQGELLKKERFAVLGHLIATVSHELRNPLGTVRNCVWSIGEAVRRGDPEGVARPLHLAERNIRRCGSIIDELLDYSRAREVRLLPTPMDPLLAAFLDEQALPEGVGLVRGTASGAVAAVDRVLFRRCFQNVVENALQAMEGAGGTGHLLAVECVAVGDAVEVRVSDTGPGVPPELRERVFEPLFSTKPTGVGLGLPLVKDVMEKHRGAVEIRDAEGGGAAVVLRLPRIVPPAEG